MVSSIRNQQKNTEIAKYGGNLRKCRKYTSAEKFSENYSIFLRNLV